MNSFHTNTHSRRIFPFAAVAVALLASAAAETDEPVYPDVSRKDYRDTGSLTAADWVGADGVVYPRWDKAGVAGGIPSADWPVVSMVPWFPGSRDITKELQAAIDEAGRKVQEEGLPGGVVLIPHGTYTLSEPISVVYDGVAIRGAGKGSAGPGTGVTRLMFQFDRPDDGSPWIIVHRFDGKVTQNSLIMVYADARYQFNNDDDPVEPNRTIQMYGLRSLDADGKVLREREQQRDGVTQQAFFRHWEVGAFADEFRKGETVRLQPFVKYEDGSVVEGGVFEVSDIEWDRPPVRNHRRPERRLGGHASLRGVFTFIGDQWTHRSNHQFLAKTTKRGDTLLVFENDVSIEENGGFVPGDLMRLEAANSDWLKETTGGGHPRVQMVTVVSVEGNEVTIDQPLRMGFPRSEGETDKVSYITPVYPIQNIGLEDLVIQFPDRRDWYSAVSTMNARNFWMRDVRIIDVGQYGGFMSSVKNGEIRDCEFIGAHWPKSGGTAYIGFAGCYDSLIENVVAVGQRHAPDFHGGAGNVVRNSQFSGSDLQWHNGYGVEHLVENVRVGDNASGGSYGRALHTPDTGKGQMHSPPGPRNVIWNSEIFGPAGGIHLGGYQQGWIFAYNRIHVERGPALSMRDRQTNHLILGNTIIMEDLFSPVLRQGGQGRGANTPEAERKRAELATGNHGIELIGNTIHGSNNELVASWEEIDNAFAPLRRNQGNCILPPDHSAKLSSEPPFPSLLDAQRENPEGMTPKDKPLYDPAAADGEKDNIPRKTGELVAQVNFARERDLNEVPGGWLHEFGLEFGERDGGSKYGWNEPVKNGRANRAGRDPGTVLYDTNNVFGGRESEWTIELPPGKYEVEIGLGDSRLPNWGTHNSNTEGNTYYAIHDIMVNGRLLKDRDGNMDKYDVHHAVVEVDEASNNRLILTAGPRAGVLRIQFIRIHKSL